METLVPLSRFVLFSLGGTDVTVASLFAAMAALLVAFIIARFVGLTLRRVRQSARYARGSLYLVEKLSTYGIVVVGFAVALTTLGLNLSALAIFFGAFGLGIGLGLQGVVKEFVSGLVLIFDRHVNIGDYIELDSGRRGQVQEIGPRATRIRTNDNVYILLPNSALIENTVVNWTLRDAVRRIHIPFSVAYGTDKTKVRDAVLAAAHSIPFTLPDEDDRKTQVWLVGFGDCSLNFELVVWPTLEACKRPAAMHAAYTWAIDDALCGANIEIPLPQREIRVRSMFGREGDDALTAMGLDGHVKEKPAATPPPGINDAAEDLQRPSDPLEPEDIPAAQK